MVTGGPGGCHRSGGLSIMLGASAADVLPAEMAGLENPAAITNKNAAQVALTKFFNFSPERFGSRPSSVLRFLRSSIALIVTPFAIDIVRFCCSLAPR